MNRIVKKSYGDHSSLSKNPYPDRYLGFGLGVEYVARQFMSQRNRHMN
jgi:hypothetical protein